MALDLEQLVADRHDLERDDVAAVALRPPEIVCEGKAITIRLAGNSKRLTSRSGSSGSYRITVSPACRRPDPVRRLRHDPSRCERLGLIAGEPRLELLRDKALPLFPLAFFAPQ